MKLTLFWDSILSWFVFLPAAVLCLAPMKNQLKKSFAVTIRNMFLVLVPLVFAATMVEMYLSLPYNLITVTVLVVAFISFHKSVKADLAKSLAVFFLVCVLMGFVTNAAVLYDAWVHPTLDIEHSSTEMTLVQMAISVGITALLFYPMYRYGSQIIDRFDIRKVWIVTLPQLTIFLIYNMLVTPQKYETVHVNKIFISMCMTLGLLFILLVLLCMVFYFIVDGLIAASETRERNQFLEMQESHYMSVQRYMDETARVRHDFKHTIGTLSDLAAQGDVNAVREYLDAYLEAQPKSDTTHYCTDTAVNALLNHYMHRALEQRIEIDLEVDLPKDTVGSTSVHRVDMCSILGNILENAIIACSTVPEDKRYVDLLIRNDSGMLYIVASNTFDGKVRVKDGRYLSTHRHGQGIGLSSITSTAKKYGGTVRFSHDDSEFRTDVVIPL